MKFNSFVFFNFVILNFFTLNESTEREQRQLFYGDMPSKLKPFFPRSGENDESTRYTDESINVKTKASPGPTIYQLFAEKSKILANPNPDDPPFSSQFNSFDDKFYAKPVFEKPLSHPKPAYEESFNLNPKPVYEESYRPRPTFGKPIRHKPKPAYEEPYHPKPYVESSATVHGDIQSYKPRPIYESSHALTASSQSKSVHRANHYNDHKEEKKNPIPGIPGQDYPIYNKVPSTSFSCEGVPFRPGMYANPETGCQAYHVCHDDRHGHQGAAFLCTNGTVFNQETFNCDWWYKVDCSQATSLYSLNSDPEFNPYFKKPAEEIVYKQSTGDVGYKKDYAIQQLKPIKGSNSVHSPQLRPAYRQVEKPKPFSATFGNPTDDLVYKSESSVHQLQPIFSTNSFQEPQLSSSYREVREPSHTAIFSSDFTSPINHEVTPQKPRIKSNRIKSENPFSDFGNLKKEMDEISIIFPEIHDQNRRTFETVEKAEQPKHSVLNYQDTNILSKPESIEDNNKALFKRPMQNPTSSVKRIIKRKRPRPTKADVISITTTTETVPERSLSRTTYTRPKHTEKAQFREAAETSDGVPDDITMDFEWGQRTS